MSNSEPREETLTNIIVEQQKLYLKITLENPPEQVDLLKLNSCENLLANLKSVSRKSKNPQHLNGPRKRTPNVEQTAEKPSLPPEMISFIYSIQPLTENTATQHKPKRYRLSPTQSDSGSSSPHNKKRRKLDTSDDRAAGFTQPPGLNVPSQNRPQTQGSIRSSPKPSRPETRPLNERNEVIVNSDKRHGETAFSTPRPVPNGPAHNQAQRSASNRPSPKHPGPVPLDMQKLKVVQTNTSYSRTTTPTSALAGLSLRNEPMSRIYLNCKNIRPTKDEHKWLFKSHIELDDANSEGRGGAWRLPQLPQEYRQALMAEMIPERMPRLQWNLPPMSSASLDQKLYVPLLKIVFNSPMPRVIVRTNKLVDDDSVTDTLFMSNIKALGNLTPLHMTAILGKEIPIKNLLKWAPCLGLD